MAAVLLPTQCLLSSACSCFLTPLARTIATHTRTHTHTHDLNQSLCETPNKQKCLAYPNGNACKRKEVRDLGHVQAGLVRVEVVRFCLWGELKHLHEVQDVEGDFAEGELVSPRVHNQHLMHRGAVLKRRRQLHTKRKAQGSESRILALRTSVNALECTHTHIHTRTRTHTRRCDKPLAEPVGTGTARRRQRHPWPRQPQTRRATPAPAPGSPPPAPCL